MTVRLSNPRFLALTDFSGLGLEGLMDEPRGRTMLRRARTWAKNDYMELTKNMATLLWTFTTMRMTECVDGILPAELRQAFDKLLLPADAFIRQTLTPAFGLLVPFAATSIDELPRLYNLYDVWIEDGIPPMDVTFTLPRLSLAFPFETAVIRSKNLDRCRLPGALGNLDPILAFPGAALIIPRSWTSVRCAWRQWFTSFINATFSDDRPPRMDERLRWERFCEVLEGKATTSDQMMKFLGVAK